jgi:PhoH-like ATPase
MTPASRPKLYLCDTNVLVHNPYSILDFQENTVIIPIEVLEEIDKFKRESSDRGAHARTVSRLLDGFRAQGRLSDGIPLPNGGRLQVVLPPGGNSRPHGPVEQSVDDRLVEMTRELQTANPEAPTILVTKDINLRIKADALGLCAEDYETDHVKPGDLYPGTFELAVAPERFSAFRATGSLPLNGEGPRRPNEYCTVTSSANPKQSLLARVDPVTGCLVPLRAPEPIWGIRPQNREQRYALDALLAESVRLVTLSGKAGTGKTLLAVAAGLHQVAHTRDFRRLVIARPIMPVGKELGFLPGTLDEKLDPWMRPIHDALDTLGDVAGNGGQRPVDLMRSGMIEVEALSYIRGRSLAGQFIVIDEAQNLTPLEAKTVLTRVGPGTKICFTGDLSQIDTPYLDFASSGFTHIISKFRDQAIAAHVELVKGERSELAEMAADLL